MARTRSGPAAPPPGPNYKKKLLSLSITDEPTEVAVGGEWSSDCGLMPNVSVEGFGLIGLPLSDPEARRLADVAEKAPFGKGLSTVVDETVRKTWQIDASKVTFHNPLWAAALSELTTKVAQGLGCPDPSRVRASLHKLLLYDVGGFFKAHRDTEKEPGMFATMVVQLPTAFEGGVITVKHKGVTKSLDYSGISAHRASYTAFYCDCEHAIGEVTKGHRLCLVFNLVWEGQGPSPGLGNDDDDLRLGKAISAIQAWDRDAEGPSKLIHILEHQYTMQGLALDQMKGSDRVMARLLLSLEERGYIKLYAAVLEREVSEHDTNWLFHKSRKRSWDDSSDDDTYQHCEWEQDEASTTITELRNAAGGVFNGEDIEPEDEEFLIENWEDHLGKPKSEEIDGYLGLETVTRTTTYHTSVLVFWPVKAHAETMLSLGHSMYSLQSLVKVLQEDGSIFPGDLPLGITSGREWLDRAIKWELAGGEEEEGEVALGPLVSLNHTSDADGQEEHGSSEARLLAMQGMAKLGSSDDVISLLKTFKPMRKVSAGVIKAAAVKTGWESLRPLLQEAISGELEASIKKDAESSRFALDFVAFKKLSSGLPELPDLAASVLGGLVPVLLSLPVRPPSYGLHYSSGTLDPKTLATLYHALAAYNLDDQVKVLVDTVVGDAKYSMKYITAPALMMIAGKKPKDGRARALPEDPTAAKRRYPHIGRLVEAFISPPFATGGQQDKASHLLEPKVFVMVYKIILRLKLEDPYLRSLVDGAVTAASTQRQDPLLPIVKSLVEAKLESYPHIERMLEAALAKGPQTADKLRHLSSPSEFIDMYKIIARLDPEGSSLPALVENIVTAAIPQRYDTLLPIVRRLDEAKLDSYPHIAKLLDCVTSNMEQVVRGATDHEVLRSSFLAVASLVHRASLPAEPHIDAICAALAVSKLDLQTHLVPLLNDLASLGDKLFAQRPAFVTLVGVTIAKLEESERLKQDPVSAPFRRCRPGCEVCKQLHDFFVTSASTVRMEIVRCGAGTTNRAHLYQILSDESRKLVQITNECFSCVITKTTAAQQAAYQKASQARQAAIASLRAIVPAAPVVASTAAPSEAPIPLPTSATASALRQPQVPTPGQLPPSCVQKAIEERMAQLPQGSAGAVRASSTTAPKRSSSNDVIDLTDSPPPKRHNA